MGKEEVGKVLRRLYSNCGIEPLKIKEIKNNMYYFQKYRHPIQNKIIEISYNQNGKVCVLVYQDTTNALQRNFVECKTMEQFVKNVF